MTDWSLIAEIAQGGARLIMEVVKLVDRAIGGDEEAQQRLRRVEQILSKDSPTEGEFEKADDIANSKPSREDA